MPSCPACGSTKLLNKGLNRGMAKRRQYRCRECNSPFSVPDNIAATNGYSPDHGLNYQPPTEGASLKGLSILARPTEGDVKLAWYKMDVAAQERIDAIKKAIDDLNGRWPVVKPIKPPKRTYDDCLAVYGIGDPHFGMYSWDKETGHNWDLDICDKVHRAGLNELMGHTQPTKECILFNAGDHFHYDNIFQQTTRSKNKVDADSRFGKMVYMGQDAMVDWVQMALYKHEIVRVVIARGNHDDMGSHHLCGLIRQAFRDNPRVIVNNEQSVYRYERFGNSLLGFTHGNSCKSEKLPHIMSQDRRADWGEVSHTAWYYGHFHSAISKDIHGTQMHQLATLAPNEAYSYEAGYSSERAIISDIHHIKGGWTNRNRVTAASLGF